jgi:hypothetical protein
MRLEMSSMDVLVELAILQQNVVRLLRQPPPEYFSSDSTDLDAVVDGIHSRVGGPRRRRRRRRKR